ncbi:McrC family protein [Actinoplanes sp. NPDC051513]|uniref:McrC family protein n=1 Tax=Actinoplanes sp. NPDC051513 TaxID=3363908 RepID=UPI0037991A24
MEVVEYRAAALPLAPAELDYLLGLVRAASGQRVLQSIAPTREPGIFEVTPGPFVGRLGLPSGRWIDFRSRFPLTDVVELIRQSGRRPVLAGTLPADAVASRFLADAIALAFAREVEHLVGRGLAKGYVPVRHVRPPYPGRLDVAHHLGRLGARPDKLATIARRLTVDVKENRALAAALDVLVRVPLARESATRLAALGPAFGRVSREPWRADDVGRMHLTNLTAHYRNALALAETILRSQSMAPASSGLAGGSLLFHMPKVWETYVAQWLRRKWPHHDVRAPYSFPLTKDGQNAEADATVWDGDRLVALYDAKYKWPDHAPDRADVYQMVTYCERLALAECTLVYPVEAARPAVTVGSRTVHVLGLMPSLEHGLAQPDPHTGGEERVA